MDADGTLASVTAGVKVALNPGKDACSCHSHSTNTMVAAETTMFSSKKGKVFFQKAMIYEVNHSIKNHPGADFEHGLLVRLFLDFSMVPAPLRSTLMVPVSPPCTGFHRRCPFGGILIKNLA